MRILILSFYYPPDLSAGSFRTSAFVDSLFERMPPGSHIDVITTRPNRYRSFTPTPAANESRSNRSIVRIDVPGHQSGMMDQSRAFLAFGRGVLRETKNRHYDVVFATSSRLMTAALGAWVAPRVGARLYLDMRDIFVDTITDILPNMASIILEPMFSMLERFAVTKAANVNLVSQGFKPYFAERYPKKRLSFFTNGVDPEFINACETVGCAAAQPERTDKLTVLYAGNIGEGQGLDRVVPQLAKLMGRRIRFLIIGDGGRKIALQSALSSEAIDSVEVVPPMCRAELVEAYRNADVLFLHLNQYSAFEKVLPSKLFEYAATGKPIWAGVAGYAAEFVRQEISNAVVFQPCDADEARRCFDDLTIECRPRVSFVEKYSRVRVSGEMANDLLAVAGGGQPR